jgi:hypothetical protein
MTVAVFQEHPKLLTLEEFRFVLESEAEQIQQLISDYILQSSPGPALLTLDSLVITDAGALIAIAKFQHAWTMPQRVVPKICFMSLSVVSWRCHLQ